MKMWKVYDNKDDNMDWSEKLTWAYGSGELKMIKKGECFHTQQSRNL